MKTVDPSTRASRPGGLEISPDRYVEYFGREWGPKFLLRMATHLSYDEARSTGLLRSRVFHWTHTCEHFKYGCICPSQVVCSKRRLVATFTNLNAVGERSFPALRVTRERLDMLPASQQRDGERFASVAVYCGTAQSRAEGRWVDFEPIVVDTLVESRGACALAKARLSPLSWQALEMGIRQLPANFGPALYMVIVPHKITWNAA